MLQRRTNLSAHARNSVREWQAQAAYVMRAARNQTFKLKLQGAACRYCTDDKTPHNVDDSSYLLSCFSASDERAV
eukprot:2569605-Amphidinium_carterae.1